MKTTIIGISGIGPDTAKTLQKHGFNTLSVIAGASIDQLSSVPGFGTTRASRVIRAANELLATAKSSTPTAANIAIRQQSTAPESADTTTETNGLKEASSKTLTKKELKKAAKKAKKKAKKERRKAEKLKKKMARKEKHKKKKAEKARKKELKQKKHKK